MEILLSEHKDGNPTPSDGAFLISLSSPEIVSILSWEGEKDSVACHSMSGSVVLRRLTPLVVMSTFLDPEPAWCSTSGWMETTILHHSYT